MTNTARENILSNLRSAAPARSYTPSDFSVLEDEILSKRDKIARYKQVTTAVNTEVHELEGSNWIVDAENILANKGLRHILYGPISDLGRKLEQDWRALGPKLLPYQDAMEECKDILFDADAAITSTLGAISETGSLILWPTREEPRLLSLTPPVHVAVVEASKFYTTFHEAIEANQWASNMPTNALLISGPSKTSDIEQELCYGVHGPKELVVFIVH